MTSPDGAVPSVFRPSSPEAHAIADLFGVTLGICAAIFALVTVLVVLCLLRFRARGGDAEPKQTEGHTRLEIAWTVVPFLILVVLLGLTARAMSASDPPADREPDIVVVGHQWWWEARYPRTGAVTANEIHVPVGRRILLEIDAADVIHDFWVPELARKIDAVPGHPNHLWMDVSTPGSYAGACAEYCGMQHAWMRILVIAQPPEEFDAWERHEALPAPLPAEASAALRGDHLFHDLTCIKCHAIGGGGADARVAPDLTHLASRRTLAAGAVSENTPETLAAWLRDPDAWKPSSHMPNLRLNDAQLRDLVAYFETLR